MPASSMAVLRLSTFASRVTSRGLRFAHPLYALDQIHGGKPLRFGAPRQTDLRVCYARWCYNVGRTRENREDAMHHTLVPSDRVEHVNVYGRDGTKLGSIERLMLDKVSGTVAYAVIKTGGVLSTHHHYPIKWGALRYDPVRRAYETEATLEELQTGPCEFDGDEFDWGDRSRSYTHPNYWTV